MAVLGLVCGAAALPASPKTMFDRPVTILVPVGPGGTSDLIARLVSDSIRQAIRQPVVVENKPGATGPSPRSC
jgi:tripartite-type tricarboxylate transporter receptor subunit TctC